MSKSRKSEAVPAPDQQGAKTEAGHAGTPVVAASFVLVFHRNEPRLDEHELNELRRWVRSWLRADGARCLVVGCCADTAREGRLHRLQGLFEQVVECGVSPDSVRCTDTWLEQPLQESAAEFPEDVIWLEAMEKSKVGKGAAPVCQVFGSIHAQKERSACIARS